LKFDKRNHNVSFFSGEVHVFQPIIFKRIAFSVFFQVDNLVSSALS
jgi:hypothetical protein